MTMNRYFSTDLDITDVDACYLPEDDESSDSDVIDSDVEFHLYSQLHYSSHPNNNDKDGIVTSPSCSDVTDSDSDEVEAVDYRSKKPNFPVKDKVGPFKRADIELLKNFLSDDDEEFIPESWEIVDSVGEEDSDDDGVDIHVHSNAASFIGDIETDEEEYPVKDTSLSEECWKIDERDRSSFKLESKGRYYSDTPISRMRCRNCNESGHFARDCTAGKKQQACFMCGERGHIGRDCPERRNHRSSYRGSRCNRCDQEGHIQRECPDLWRQFHVTTKIGPIVIPEIPVKVNKRVYCCNCGMEGHFVFECEEEGNYYIPWQSPFVHTYDEHAVVRPPKEPKVSTMERRPETPESRRRGSSRGRKRHLHQTPQHIVFDSSPSRPVNHEKRHKDDNAYSKQFNNSKSRAEIERIFSGKKSSSHNRQHIMFDSPPSDSINYEKRFKNRNEHSKNSDRRNSRSEYEERGHEKRRRRNETSGHEFSQPKHRTRNDPNFFMDQGDKHRNETSGHEFSQPKRRTRNDQDFYMDQGDKRKRHTVTDFDDSYRNTAKSSLVPEIVYHNARKVVFRDYDSPKRKLVDSVEQFPRSKNMRVQGRDKKYDKRVKTNDWNRKNIDHGFKRRFK